MELVRTLLCGVILASALAAFAEEPQDLSPRTDVEVKQGALRVVKDDMVLECPLRHTTVVADVSGFIARVKVTQTFYNPLDENIEAVYVFPLPAHSAVDDMTMVIGDRRIVGLIKKRAEARSLYEAAVARGQTAALLEQERPNIFTQSVGNIKPNQEIKIEISYVDVLRYDMGEYTFTFPMVVGPRYNPPGFTDGIGAVPTGLGGASGQPTEVQYLRPGQRNGHDIDLMVILDAGVPVRDMKVTNHQANIQQFDGRTAEIRLSPADNIPNKDFVLRYKVAGEKPELAVLANRSVEEKPGYFMLMIQPKIDEQLKEAPPREVCFLIDVSGSMGGEPTDKVKEAMSEFFKRSKPEDTFQVVTFAGAANSLFEKYVPATAENIEQALNFSQNIRGGGGTNMLEGIKKVVEAPVDPERVRIVVMLTDGFIGNESQIIEEVNRKCGDNIRFWAVGIGSSPNRYLIDGVAKAGGGMGKDLGLNDAAAPLVEEIVERIHRAQLANIRIDWSSLPVYEVFPLEIPELWAGRPVIIHGKYRNAAVSTITISGTAEGKPLEYSLQVNLPEKQGRHDVLAKVWARKKIEDLSDQMHGGEIPELVDEITRVALNYRLMSQYTSFVAVDEQDADSIVTPPNPPRRISIPVPMPDGVSYEGVFGREVNLLVEDRKREEGVEGSGFDMEVTEPMTLPPPSVSTDLGGTAAYPGKPAKQTVSKVFGRAGGKSRVSSLEARELKELQRGQQQPGMELVLDERSYNERFKQSGTYGSRRGGWRRDALELHGEADGLALMLQQKAQELADQAEGKISFEFKDQAIQDALAFLAAATNTEIVCGSDVQDVVTAQKITLKMEEATLPTALNYVLQAGQLDFELKGNRIIIHPNDFRIISAEYQKALKLEDNKQLDAAAAAYQKVYLLSTFARDYQARSFVGAAVQSLLRVKAMRSQAAWEKLPALQNRLDLVLRRTSLPDALAQVGAAGNVAVEIDPASFDDAKEMLERDDLEVIYLDLRNATVAQALDWLLDPFKMEWHVLGEKAAIGTSRRLFTDIKTPWVYSIGSIATPTAEELGENKLANRQLLLQAPKKIQAAVEGAVEGGEVRLLDDSRLLVVADRAGHDQAKALLDALRGLAPNADQNSVTARRYGARQEVRAERKLANEQVAVAGALLEYSCKLLAGACGGVADDESLTNLQSAWNHPQAAEAVKSLSSGARAQAVFALCESALVLRTENVVQLAEQALKVARPYMAASLGGDNQNIASLIEKLEYAVAIQNARAAGVREPALEEMLQQAQETLPKANSWISVVASALLQDAPAANLAEQLQAVAPDNLTTEDAVMLYALACRKAGRASWENFRVRRQDMTARYGRIMSGDVMLIINRLSDMQLADAR